jgi:hypothetical protein
MVAVRTGSSICGRQDEPASLGMRQIQFLASLAILGAAPLPAQREETETAAGSGTLAPTGPRASNHELIPCGARFVPPIP